MCLMSRERPVKGTASFLWTWTQERKLVRLAHKWLSIISFYSYQHDFVLSTQSVRGL